MASLTLVKGNNRITNTFPRLHTSSGKRHLTSIEDNLMILFLNREVTFISAGDSHHVFDLAILRVKGVTIVCDHLRELLEKIHHGERATPHDSTEAERKQKSYNHYVEPQRPLPLH